MNPKVKSFYHKDTYTWTHVLSCPETKTAVIVDPVLDYSADNANTSTQSIDAVLEHISSKDLVLKYVLETHAHADHLTAAAYIAKQTQAKIAIGVQIQSVQETFKSVFNLKNTFKTDGSQFDILLVEGDEISIGACDIKVMHVPGHTNDSMAFICGDCVFIGDTLFSPDYGSARCDFPGGDAEKLYDSVQKIYALGDSMKLYLCHDYPPNNRKPLSWFLSSIQQSENIHINHSIKKDAFIKMRNKRDATLSPPELIIPSVQVNIRAGVFPEPESNGKIYLKIPVDVLGNT